MAKELPKTVQAELTRKATLARHVFGSPDGQKMLQVLKQEFGGSCYEKGDPHHTAYREGGRDVLLYIEELIQYAQRGTNYDWMD